MRKSILIAGTAVVLSASPAAAGGPTGMLGGVLGGGHGKTSSTSGPANRASAAGSCLCQAVHGLTGRAGSAQGMAARGVGRVNGLALTNSVSGVSAVTLRGKGHATASVRSVGLAGVVSGSGNAAASVRGLGVGHGNARGVGLAGNVSATVRSTVRVSGVSVGHAGLAGRVSGVAAGLAGSGHGKGALVNVSALNARGTHGSSVANVAVLNGRGGRSGSVVNVSALNARGTHGRSVASVAVLNGRGGSSGKVANVSVLNGTGTHGRSAVNVAALNGSAGGKGRLVNVAVLNGKGAALGQGIRLINGVPCGPDGKPLTGAAAVNAMVALGLTRPHGGGSSMQPSSPPPSGGSKTGTGAQGANGVDGADGGSAPAAGGTQGAAPQQAALQRDRRDPEPAAIGPGSMAGPQVRYLPRHN